MFVSSGKQQRYVSRCVHEASVKLRADVDILCQRRQLDESLQKGRQTGRIKRSLLLASITTTTVILNESIGSRHDFVKSLDSRIHACIAGITRIERRSHSLFRTVHSLAVDPATSSIVSGQSTVGGSHELESTTLATWPHPKHPSDVECPAPFEVIGAPLCLTISPARTVCCTAGSTEPDAVIFGQLGEREIYPSNINNSSRTRGQRLPGPLFDGLTAYHVSNFPTIHSLAANPFPLTDRRTTSITSAGSTFAVGHTHGVTLYTASATRWDEHSCTPLVSSHAGADVLSLDWLDINTLAMAQRNGRVRLWDTRTNPRGGKGYIDRLYCRGPLDTVRCVDGSRMILRGVNEEPGLWDLRMAAPVGIAGQKKGTTTLPLVRYPGVQGADGDGARKKGLDLCPSLGLMAAGDCEGNVKVFRTGNGELLGVLRVDALRPGPYTPAPQAGDRVHCLRFVESDSHGVVIVAAKGTRIMKWERIGSDVPLYDNKKGRKRK